MKTYTGIFTVHPTVTIEHRPSGPVVVHNRRGTPEQVKRSRQTALTVGAVGVMLILVTVLWLWSRERLDAPEIGLAVLALAALVLAVGYSYFIGKGWVEIERIGDRLLVSGFPVSRDGNSWLVLALIDHIRVEGDPTLRPGRYRVRFADLNGRAIFRTPGLLSGVGTIDEAQALAGAIAAQFDLQFVSGVHAAPVPTSQTEPRQPATIWEAGPQGKIHITESAGVTVVEYQHQWGTTVGTIILVAFWYLVLSILTIAAVTEHDLTLRATMALFLVPFWIAGFAPLAFAFTRTQFLSPTGSGHLVRRNQILKNLFGSTQIAMVNIEYIRTAVGWDSYNDKYHYVVAVAKAGEDLVLVDNLPETDGHALCQALHQHLGLPIQ